MYNDSELDYDLLGLFNNKTHKSQLLLTGSNLGRI